MTFDQDERFKATCLHEAAHLTIAHALGGTASHMIVTIPGYLVDGSLGLATASCADPKDDVIVLLSGVIGAMFGMGIDYGSRDPRPIKGTKHGEPVSHGSGLIVKSAEPPAVYQDEQSFIEAIQSGGSDDRRRAWKSCRKLCQNDEQAFELYQALEEKAVVLVVENLERIRMVADVLGRKLVMGRTAINALLG